MKDSVTSREILSVIEFWCVNPASGSKKILQYTKERTNEINRGGLINFTVDFYIFMRHVEISAPNMLNTNLGEKIWW